MTMHGLLPFFLPIKPHTRSNVKSNSTNSYEILHNSSLSSSNSDHYTTHHYRNYDYTIHRVYTHHRNRRRHQNRHRIWRSLPHMDPAILSLMIPKSMPTTPFLQPENEGPQWAWTAEKTSYDRFAISSGKQHDAISMIMPPKIIPSVQTKDQKTQLGVPLINIQKTITGKPPTELANEKIMSTKYEPVQWHFNIPSLNIPKNIPRIPSMHTYNKKTKQSTNKSPHRHQAIKVPKVMPIIQSVNQKIKQPDSHHAIPSMKIDIPKKSLFQLDNPNTIRPVDKTLHQKNTHTMAKISGRRRHIVDNSVNVAKINTGILTQPQQSKKTPRAYSSIKIMKNMPGIPPLHTQYHWTSHSTDFHVHFSSLHTLWNASKKTPSVAVVAQKPSNYSSKPTHDRTDLIASKVILSSHHFSQFWKKPPIALAIATKKLRVGHKLIPKAPITTKPMVSSPHRQKTWQTLKRLKARKKVNRSPIRKKSTNTDPFTFHPLSAISYGGFQW